jgi:hypothetical protein
MEMLRAPIRHLSQAVVPDPFEKGPEKPDPVAFWLCVWRRGIPQFPMEHNGNVGDGLFGEFSCPMMLTRLAGR